MYDIVMKDSNGVCTIVARKVSLAVAFKAITKGFLFVIHE